MMIASLDRNHRQLQIPESKPLKTALGVTRPGNHAEIMHDSRYFSGSKQPQTMARPGLLSERIGEPRRIMIKPLLE